MQCYPMNVNGSSEQLLRKWDSIFLAILQRISFTLLKIFCLQHVTLTSLVLSQFPLEKMQLAMQFSNIYFNIGYSQELGNCYKFEFHVNLKFGQVQRNKKARSVALALRKTNSPRCWVFVKFQTWKVKRANEKGEKRSPRQPPHTSE